MTADNEPKLETRKKSLLEKYEIPITHLDFSYIRECSNVVELERIVRILRSNEEGYYPELLRTAEEKLRELDPGHKLLRVFDPVFTKSQIPSSEWNDLEKDLRSWKNEITDVEQKLSCQKDCPEPSNIYPQVRRPASFSTNQPKPVKKEQTAPKAGTDYRKWDMFDADSECLKLDLAEEKLKEEAQKKVLEEKKKNEEVQLSLEEKEIQAISATVDGLSEEERHVLSLKEKGLGNEFYNTNRLDNAIRHYTRSIYLHPTAASYNNRAATYLKQCRFSKALDDLNIVLEMEPDNVKAHYRRAMAYQHKNEFQKALDDILEVLKHEPKHVLARHVADQLRENCASLPRKLRIKVRDENNPTQLIVKEVTEEELKRDYQDLDYLEVNDNGLPKIMCNCNGKYTNDPIMKNNDPLKYQHMWQNRRYHDVPKEIVSEMERNGKRTMQTSNRTSDDSQGNGAMSKRNKPLIEPVPNNAIKPGAARRLDIIELEKIEEDKEKPNALSSAPATCYVTDKRTEKVQKMHFGEDIEEKDVPVSKDLSSVPFKTKDEKMSFNTDVQASDRAELDNNKVCPPQYNYCFWDNDTTPAGRFDKLETSPQSPLFSNSSVNGEFSSDMDSDEDMFASDPTSVSCKVSISRVEKIMDNDIDTISKDLFPVDDLPKCECGEGYRLRPHQFNDKWQALQNSPEERGRLIRLLCPHQLHSVIGNTLDESLLSGFISSLSYYFDHETEKDKIVKYLEYISGLQRFRIIASFLSSKDRAAVDNLLKKLHPVNNNIEEAFVPLACFKTCE